MRSPFTLPFHALLLLSALLCVSALKLSGKISVTTADGLENTYSADPSLDKAPAIDLEGSTWKLTFTTETEPLNQAHILFEADSGDVTLPVTVKKGKGSFTINSAKLPAALVHTSGALKPTLLLSTLEDKASQPLGAITIPASSLQPAPRGRHDIPPRQGEPAFQVLPEITHTFQPEPKSIGIVKSFIGLGLVVGPWFLLAYLHGVVSPSYAGLSGYSNFFLGSLLALEGLTLTYWIGLRLHQFLLVFLPLSLVSAYAGRLALANK